MADELLLLETGGTDNLLLETGDNLLLESSTGVTPVLWRSGGKFGLALLMYDAPGGQLLYDWTLDASGVSLSDGDHDHESLGATIHMNVAEMFRVYDQLRFPYHVVLSSGFHAWTGRLEGREITARGLRIQALGYWRALSDYGPYTAFWSDYNTARWKTITQNDLSSHNPDKWEIDFNNRLRIVPRSGEVFSSTQRGGVYYIIPDGSLRQGQAIQFKINFLAPSSTWTAYVTKYSSSFGSASNSMTLTGSGSLITRAYYLEPSNADVIAVWMAYDSTSATYSGETGVDAYLELTSVRVASSTTNKVNTTASAISAGANTITPGDMTNIYEGMQLVIDSGTSVGEMITVSSVDVGAGTFDATFVNDHSDGFTIQGIFIPASEIAQHVVSVTNGLNSDQLDDSTALIDDTDKDLLVELYEEKALQDIMNYLALEGASTRYEVGVDPERRLYFRERGSVAKVWYTTVMDLQLGDGLDTLINRAYGVFRNANGGILRTAEADDSLSQVKYGIVRRGFTVASTTSEALAESQRDTYLSEVSTITPRIGIVTDGLRDAQGNEYPLWLLRSGDELILQNLPPTLAESVDKVRRFRVKAKRYDVDRDILQPVPELDLPNIDIVIAGPRIKAAANDVKIDSLPLTLAAVDTY